MAEEIQAEEIQPADITEQELQQSPVPDPSGDMTIDLIYPKISSDLFEQNLRRNPEEEGYAQGTTAIKLLVITFFRVRFATLDFSFLVLVYGVWGVIFLCGFRGHAGSLGEPKVGGLTRSGKRTKMLRETKNYR